MAAADIILSHGHLKLDGFFEAHVSFSLWGKEAAFKAAIDHRVSEWPEWLSTDYMCTLGGRILRQQISHVTAHISRTAALYLRRKENVMWNINRYFWNYQKGNMQFTYLSHNLLKSWFFLFLYSTTKFLLLCNKRTQKLRQFLIVNFHKLQLYHKLCFF